MGDPRRAALCLNGILRASRPTSTGDDGVFVNAVRCGVDPRGAVHRAVRSLDASLADVQWVVESYALFLAAFDERERELPGTRLEAR
jgi:hypothetical protein